MHKITLAKGDGIGPEIMDATLKVLRASGFRFDFDEIGVGKAVYEKGHSSGIAPDAWEKIVKNRVLLKAPITTPQGGGFKSLNVTIRKTLGLFANVRPVRSFHPFVKTKHPNLDIVIVRENEEDLYAGIEHRQTPEVYQCLKLITDPGSEKIVRYAFEYARQMGRRKVTCMTKDNIMKLTDGLFHKTFEKVAAEYKDIEWDHMIIDIGAAKLAACPENFDVVVTPNLYGDIVSDIVAEISGSVGLAGSSNIGLNCSMFEAIHGSAPDIAGKSVANPSGLLFAACHMLNHLGETSLSASIENALLKTIEDGIATKDIYTEAESSRLVGTSEFADEVIHRLGSAPTQLKEIAQDREAKPIEIALTPKKSVARTLDGVDVFLYEEKRDPVWIADQLKKSIGGLGFELSLITNRGVKVFPDGNPETFCTDHWRCRFLGSSLQSQQIVKLLGQIGTQGLEVIKTENLYSFDGQKGYSLGQGQ
ncbi:MAG: NADP-dependent isocitrate dehydrogenase [Pseudomonadota bacterium]